MLFLKILYLAFAKFLLSQTLNTSKRFPLQKLNTSRNISFYFKRDLKKTFLAFNYLSSASVYIYFNLSVKNLFGDLIHLKIIVFFVKAPVFYLFNLFRVFAQNFSWFENCINFFLICLVSSLDWELKMSFLVVLTEFINVTTMAIIHFPRPF